MWQKTFTPRGGSLTRIFKLSDCYLLMGAATDTVNYNNAGLCFSKIDSNGNRFSHHLIFDSTGKLEHWYGGANVLDDNRFVFASYHKSNMIFDTITYCVFKIVDSTGNIIHRKIIENIHKAGYSASSVLPLQNGYIMFAGDGYEYEHLDQEIFAARTDTTLYISPTNISFYGGVIPGDFILYQNYPNPFNPLTTINYELPKDGTVKLIVYDMLGREVSKLVNNEFKVAGRYSVVFDGSSLSSGIYFYKIEAGAFKDIKRMVLVK